MWEIINELQRRIEEMSTRMAQVQSQLTETNQSVSMVWQRDVGGGGGGGGGFYCPSIPAIAGGASDSTGDVYDGGSGTLVASGATIWNRYSNATTAGRICTLAVCANGEYLILAQDCP